MKRKNTPDFIIDATKIHGNKYDYSLIDYKNAITKVKIICKDHGVFEQTPNSHLNGNGCSYCNGGYQLNNDVFIKKSINVHGNKYDYNLVNYKNAITKVKIICPIHNIFEQTPNSHLNGSGCSICAIINTKKLNTISNDVFIFDSNKTHNNKYDYSLVEYKNCKIKIKIICPEHGVFEQLPDHHKRGSGCPECSKYYGNFNDKKLYILYDNLYNLYKIGVSKNPNDRVKEITKWHINKDIKILHIYNKCAKYENDLHKMYLLLKTNHPVYNDGKTEWFKLNDEILNEIDNYIKYHI
jgi:hypothetical protein